jgi:hypothetical protein
LGEALQLGRRGPRERTPEKEETTEVAGYRVKAMIGLLPIFACGELEGHDLYCVESLKECPMYRMLQQGLLCCNALSIPAVGTV